MKIIVLIASLVLFSACTYAKAYEDNTAIHDNAIEEGIEAGIKAATGADIDLTPSTPEKSSEVQNVTINAQNVIVNPAK